MDSVKVRGRKVRTHNVCKSCGRLFKRWRVDSGPLTQAVYCAGCRIEAKHPGYLFIRMNIIRMRRNNPCATLEEIGSRFGVSRERARQILSEAGKPTRKYIQRYQCFQCGKDMGSQPKLFCSPECRRNYGWIKVACSYCGQLREYSAKWLIWQIEHGKHSRELFFCSKYCQGKWLAENHGFIAHPENVGHDKRPWKWDWSKIYELRDETGWGATKISRALGIPLPTVSMILAKRKSKLTEEVNC